MNASSWILHSSSFLLCGNLPLTRFYTDFGFISVYGHACTHKQTCSQVLHFGSHHVRQPKFTSTLNTNVCVYCIFFIYYFIDKGEDILRRYAKRATQGIQYLYTHSQSNIKRKKNNQTKGAKTSSTRTQPINKTN